MNKTVLMIMGASGSGKSTLESGLINSDKYRPLDPLFHKVVSVTTRPQRWGEVQGVHYHFITEDNFDSLLKPAGGHPEGTDLIQTTEFAGNRYGSLKCEYTTDHAYAVLVAVPESVATFTPVLKEVFPGIIIKNIYFDISADRLCANMKKRGDSDDMIIKRLVSDDLEEQFQRHNLVADYTITDDTLNGSTVENVMRWLQEEAAGDING